MAWSPDPVVAWSPDPVVAWPPDPVVAWSPDPVVAWSPDHATVLTMGLQIASFLEKLSKCPKLSSCPAPILLVGKDGAGMMNISWNLSPKKSSPVHRFAPTEDGSHNYRRHNAFRRLIASRIAI